jgi:hypothetical protein
MPSLLYCHLPTLCRAGCFLALLLASPGAGQTFFTEETGEIGVPLFGSRSTAFGDYDNDGRPDLFGAESPFENQARIALLHNEGDGRFADRTAVVQQGLSADLFKGGGAIFGDYDNDGDLDLFVPVGAFVSFSAGVNMLLRNERGVFMDVALEAGLTDDLPSDNAIWLDYDRDGYIDLYVGNLAEGEPQLRNRLYRNNGGAGFADVTAATGLAVPLQRSFGGSNGGMVAGDFNDDGWPDLYVGVWQDRNRLFLNTGQGGFEDATTAEIGDPGEAFGVAIGDIDNDGDLDIFQAAGGGGLEFRSIMLLNLGNAQFLDATEGVGLAALGATQTLGPGLADIDNDGDLDLLIANPHSLYLNNGDGTFLEQTSRSGLAADIGLTASFGSLI